jgi:hypothetical protein
LHIVERLAQKYGVAWIRPHRLRSVIVPFNPFLSQGGASTDIKPAHLVVLKHWLKTERRKLADTLEEIDGCIELVVHPCLAVDNTFPKQLRCGAEERFREYRYLQRLMGLV